MLECERCGAAVMNMDKHIVWHANLRESIQSVDNDVNYSNSDYWSKVGDEL